MQKIISYLKKNPEVLNRLQANELCLIGVTPEENKAILDVIHNKKPQLRAYLWK